LRVPAATDAAALDELLPTAAALLLREAEHGEDEVRAGALALMRAALGGAETFVWEWDIDSDRLSDIDQGFLLLGYDAAQIGHTQDDWNALIHPDERAANHEAYLRHARGEAEIYEHVYRARDAAGRWRWLLERGRIVEHHPDGRPRRMLGTQTDITARRAIEAAASEANERLARIAEHVPGMLFQLRREPDGRTHFAFASERCRALLGLEPEALRADAAAMLRRMEPADRKTMLASVAASARTLQRWQVDFRIHVGDGSIRWMRGDASPRRESDGATLWHGYIEDATERRELERAQGDAAAAAAANRAKTEFLSRMSHELRTPLNAVLGFTQLLEIDEVDPPSEGQARRLKLIRDAGEHLLQMIGDLLDLTRIESGGMTLRLDTVALREIAAAGLEMLRAEAERAQVALQLAPGGAGLSAHADRTRLRQVVLNLLSNAIKYNRPGGRVEVTIEPVGDDRVRLIVRDTGIGIAEPDLGRLFDPFFRAAGAPGAVDGAGIGLAVTRSLVGLMGGRVDVQSTPGAGSAFSVTLPAAAA
jgi:PAS domain S-box-containing protein